MKTATATDPATTVRVPQPLMAQIDAEAKKNGRSRNSEIVIRLNMTFEASTNAA